MEMELGRFRLLSGLKLYVSRFLSIGLPLLVLLYILGGHIYLGIPLIQAQLISLTLAFALSAVFLNVPATKSTNRERLPWYDFLLILLSLLVAGYPTIFYYKILLYPGLSLTKIGLGIICLIVVIEAIRRVFGWLLVGICIFFILFGLFGNKLGLHQTSIRLGTWIVFLYLSNDAIIGNTLWAIIGIVLPFVLFGQMLFGTGGGPAFIKFATAVAGKYKGGPAKIAIVSSCLFGMMSGSPSANVAGTGMFTIPLMKRMGYRPEFAGAVEAAASTGGSIMPPVMSVCAFIIAQILNINYIEVALAAFIPAFLYYFGLFVQVHEEAVGKGLVGMPANEIPPIKGALKGVFIYIFPVAVIFYALLVYYIPAEMGALYGIGSLIILCCLGKEKIKQLKNLPSILEDTGKLMMELIIIGAYAGIIVGVVTFSNLGINFSQLLISLSGGNVFLLAILIAIAGFILGTGLPIIASYILLAYLVAPAFIHLGVPPLAAHLFVLYWATTSFLTPPVCMAVFVAKTIAGSDFMKTALISIRLGLMMYVAPFIFIFNTSLLGQGSPINVILVTLFAFGGVGLIAIAFSGFCLNYKLKNIERIISTIISILLLFPSLKINWIGVMSCAGIVLLNLKKIRRCPKVT